MPKLTNSTRARVTRAPSPLPLFLWAAAQPATRHRTPQARLILLHHSQNADGEPRPGLLVPGQRVPRAYPNMAAALAALRSMEAGR